MTHILFSAVAFVVAIGLLVTVHEFGHFWVARRAGVKVLRFSVGFGKPLWRWQKHDEDPEYVLAAIPLGGYVKMLDEREGEVAQADLPRAFNRQPLYKRFAIVSAGPIFNFLFAVVAYWLMFVVGITGLKPVVGTVDSGSLAQEAGIKEGDVIIAVDGKSTPTWETVIFAMLDQVLEGEPVTVQVADTSQRQPTYVLEPDGVSGILDRGNVLSSLGINPARPMVPALIGFVEAGGPAQLAGLKPGDRLIAADGTPLTGWSMWVDYVRQRPDVWIELEIERAGERRTLELRPARKSDPQAGEIGYIGAGVEMPDAPPEEYQAVLQYQPAAAVGQAVSKTWQVSVLTVRMLGKMLVGEASVENISGPISIAQYAGYSAAIGIGQFLAFLAIVSVSLGILNLLPVPLLDGGHLMFYIVELIKGSPVSEVAQLVGQRVGIALLGALMCLAFYNDIMRLIVR